MRVPAWKPLGAAAALVIGQALAMAPPAAANTGPIVISADMPGAVPAGHMWAFNDFFPRSLRVVRGQTIGFAIQGFHTATLLPAGVSAKSDLRKNGIATADEDLAANPNGTSHVAIDFPAVMPTSFTCGSGANPCSFTGTSVVSSGAPLGPPPAGPFMVTVNAKPGTYAFLCRIHPGMTGHITVVDSGDHASSASHVANDVAEQVRSDVKAGYRAERKATEDARHDNHDGTTTWYVSPGAQSPDRRVAVLEFLPQNISIKSGDRVVWKMRESNEPHTVTFPNDIGTDQIPLCETAGGAPDAGAVPVKFPPAGPQDFGCPAPGTGPVEFEFGGGNGVSTVSSPATVSDSGLMGSRRLARSYGLPQDAVLNSWAVKFTAATPGTYTYVCQIHEGMAGTVKVS
jgi:plastocyanin